MGVTLRANDLALGPNEAKALLVDRDDAFVSQWRARLHGWPLALMLLSRGAADADLPDANALTTGHALFDSLADAIFGQLPRDLAQAARSHALPRRFDDRLLAALLNASLEHTRAVRLELQRRALFLEVTEPAGWFKYHDAVREFLIAQLDEAPRAALTETLIERFEADGKPHLAIEGVLDAGLPERAARLLNWPFRVLRTLAGALARRHSRDLSHAHVLPCDRTVHGRRACRTSLCLARPGREFGGWSTPYRAIQSCSLVL